MARRRALRRPQPGDLVVGDVLRGLQGLLVIVSSPRPANLPVINTTVKFEYEARLAVRAMSGCSILKRNRRSQTEHRGVADLSTRRVGVWNAGAGVDDILECWLQLPPGHYLVLVAELHQQFI